MSLVIVHCGRIKTTCGEPRGLLNCLCRDPGKLGPTQRNGADVPCLPSGEAGAGTKLDGGSTVFARVSVIAGIALPLALAGCANDVPSSSSFMPSPAIATAAMAASPAPAAADPSYRKTMSDRVLTAIALERVTGMKPDPARLMP